MHQYETSEISKKQSNIKALLVKVVIYSQLIYYFQINLSPLVFYRYANELKLLGGNNQHLIGRKPRWQHFSFNTNVNQLHLL